MNKIFIFLILLVAVEFNSCETDINVNADYKDITVVYALINPIDTTHYVKINKAFLGNPSVLVAAENAANFNYAANELTVEITEHDFAGVYVKTYALTRTENEIPKDPGVFDNSINVLYKFIEPNIDRNSTYNLTITNNESGKVVTAETKIVGNTSVSLPTITKKLKFWSGTPGSGQYLDENISVVPGNEIGRLDVTLIFKYMEYYTIASGLAPVEKKVIMPLGERITVGTNSLEWQVNGSTFFDNILNNVTDPINIPFFSHRELANIPLEINVAGTELSTYMLVSEPSNTVNQDKPSYTNIDNGLGIFSSRTKFLWESIADPLTGNININDDTILKLQSLNLGFCFGFSTTSQYKCTQL